MLELVSVLMPAKNAADYIQSSIESILSQSYTNLELIIVDDQSEDHTREIIESFNDSRIVFVEGFGSGISAAFNAGLDKAKGTYFCRCDADDLYPPDRIQIQVDWLRANATYVAVCGNYSSIDNKNRHLIQYNREAKSQNIDDELKSGETRTHFCTFMVRMTVLKDIGGCRAFFVTAEDIDLQLRLSQQGSIYFLHDNFYRYRLHNISITHTQAGNVRKFYEHFARECHQKRMQRGHDDLDEGIIPQLPEVTTTADDSESKIINQLISESWYWHQKKMKWRAIKTGFYLVRVQLFSWLAWRNFLLIIVK